MGRYSGSCIEITLIGSIAALLGGIALNGIRGSGTQGQPAQNQTTQRPHVRYNFEEDYKYRGLESEFRNPSSKYYLGPDKEEADDIDSLGVGMIMDSSGSMKGEKMDAAKSTAIKFLGRLDGLKKKGRKVKAGLLYFTNNGDGFEFASHMEAFDYRKLAEIVRRLEANGGTPLGLSTAAMHRELKKTCCDRRIVGYTDGKNEGGERPEYIVYGIMGSETKSQVYWVGFQVDESDLKRMEDAGAHVFKAESAEELDEAFNTIAGMLESTEEVPLKTEDKK